MHPANNLMRVDKYYRSADLLERQARQYRRQANEEQLYVMLMRLVSLVVETIPQHSGFQRDDPNYQAMRKLCLFEVMPELERLKISLDLKDRTSRLLEEEPWAPTKEPGTIRLAAGNMPEVQWRRNGGSVATLAIGAAAAGASLAGSDPFALQGSPLPSPGGPGTAAAVPLSIMPDLPRSLHLPAATADTLSRHAILPDWQQQQQQQWEGSRAAPAATPAPRTSMYPEVMAQLASLESAAPDPLGDAALRLGPQAVGVELVLPPTTPPDPGDTCCMEPPPSTLTVPEPALGGSKGGVAEVTRRQSVRDVHVSVALMDEFLRYATSNTKNGVESCGILAGTLSVNDAVFTITTLIVPKQEGTSDTVQALCEEEIFEAQDSRGLYPLGWIHTHPTQTCFLSSIDVHTQCGYQTMLDEAVAIVMAPRDPSKRVGIFRLSTPGGLKGVQRCEKRGFHMHPPTSTGQPLYEFCKHVYLNPRVNFEVVDLR